MREMMYWNNRAQELRDQDLQARPNARLNSGNARVRAGELAEWDFNRLTLASLKSSLCYRETRHMMLRLRDCFLVAESPARLFYCRLAFRFQPS
jgi:hypothetical protein